MKTFLLLLILPIPIFSGTWNYQEDEKILYYDSQPFPFFQAVQTPIGYFAPLFYASNPLQQYGWVKMQQQITPSVSNSSISPGQEKKGWYFSTQKPANISDEWVFFPQIALWTKPETLFMLYRLWDNFYEYLPRLDHTIFNLIQPEHFYRIQTTALNKEIRTVEAIVPDGFSLIYQKILPQKGTRKLFIFYHHGTKSNHKDDVQLIKIRYYYEDFSTKETLFKLISSPNSKLQ
jgi:hypothetical protein